MKNLYKVGDRVKKWSSVMDIKNKKKLGKAVWTVTKVYENAASESGIILDVEIDECAYCGAHRRQMVGYDSAWFLVVGE